MEKKDVYEHLAKIYLDASSKRKKKSKAYPKIFQNVFLVSTVFIFGLSSFLWAVFYRSNPFKSEIALFLQAEATRINFNFNPAKKETFSLNLNKLNLTPYKRLGFSVKKANYRDYISVRIEFVNAFKENSEIYIKDIAHRWRDYKINLSEFKNISDWSEMSTLIFTVEEWNVREKKGLVYIDNVRLIK
jgi:hypothetical protein